MRVIALLALLALCACTGAIDKATSSNDRDPKRIAVAYYDKHERKQQYDRRRGKHIGGAHNFVRFASTTVRVSFQEMCTGEETFTIGECSPAYIMCDYKRSEYDVEFCQPQKVFFDGRCVKAATSCRDSRMEQISADTERLLQSADFCSQGQGVYAANGRQCSRQAVVCNTQGRLFAAWCPSERTMSSRLQCIPSSHDCSSLSISFDEFAPMKAEGIQWHCGGEPAHVDLWRQHRSRRCSSWYVDCHSKTRELINCDYGQIYDKERRRCRHPSSEDACPEVVTCSGREWRDVSQGDCKNGFMRCEGSLARQFVCSEGFVYYHGRCVRPSETRGQCSVCIDGRTEQFAFDNCNQYSICQNGRWLEAECPYGQAFSTALGKCTLNVSCAKAQPLCEPGTSARISCTEYMECTWSRHYEWKSCPAFHSWDVDLKQCVYNADCRPQGERCSEGDITETSDCRFFHRCVDGNWKKQDCVESLFDGCTGCDNEQFKERVRHRWECRDDATRRDSGDCSGYARCIGGRWVRGDCPSGFAWDHRTHSCSSSDDCSPFREVNCVDGERVQPLERRKCNEYFECVRGTWITLTCPLGQMFDANRDGCVLLARPCSFNNKGIIVRVPKKNRERLHEPPVMHPPYHTRSEYPLMRQESRCKVGSTVRDYYDCGRYYLCTKAGLVLSTCAAGSTFSPQRGICDQEYKCDLSYCEDGETMPGQACGAFKTCRRGKWNDEFCPNNQRFISGRCEGQCGHHGGYCSDGHTVADDKDCSLYLLCSEGSYFQRQCVHGLFDPNVGHCHGGYECPRERRPHCFNEERKADSDDCTAYRLCIDGTFQRRWCSPGHRFSSHTNQCVRGQCSGQSGGGIETEKCKEDGGPRGYRADPYNCRKFYQCAHGKWVHKDCPANLAWNIRATTCDYPNNVPGCDIN